MIKSLTELALYEINCMAWLARCEIMTNRRDIYSTGIYEWNRNLAYAKNEIELIIKSKFK